MNIGGSPRRARESIEFSERYPFMWSALDIHPHIAHDVDDSDYELLEALYSHPKVCAVGEIGLDFHYDFCPRDIQLAAFRRGMDTARRLSLPVCIHDREAHQATMEVLREYPEVTGVFHSYSGSLEMARELLKMGYVFSFNGIITFKNAKKFAPIIKELPFESILIETDCPYLAPEPYRGRRNDSTRVIHVCEKIAEIRGVSVEEAARQTTENAKRLYRIHD